jgi:hypothetical protein
MKKRHFVLITILILIGLFIAFSAAAHPYDAPLTFIEHKTDDGRPIYNSPESNTKPSLSVRISKIKDDREN